MMERIEIVIVDEIKTRMALHDFGIPIKKILNEKLTLVKSPTLFILDLRNVNPMDYEFVNISFKEIILNFKSDKNIFIVFKVDKWEFEELCTGLLDILNLRNVVSQSEAETLATNGFSMVYVDENNNTLYLSNLKDDQMKVLKEIENHDCISSTEIQSTFSLIAEDTAKILEDLKHNKFIYEIEGPKYCPIKNKI